MRPNRNRAGARTLLILWMVLLALVFAGCSGGDRLLPPPPPEESAAEPVPSREPEHGSPGDTEEIPGALVREEPVPPAPPGTEVPVPGDPGTPADAGAAGTDGPAVSLRIDGYGGEEILPWQETAVREGDRVLDVLRRTAGEQGIGLEVRGRGFSAYVSGIGELFEFDHGPGSGWVYSVNGEFPRKGAGTEEIAPGDRIHWQYTLDGGRDAGALP